MLSKKYNPMESEKKWQEYWKDINIYKYNLILLLFQILSN